MLAGAELVVAVGCGSFSLGNALLFVGRSVRSTKSNAVFAAGDRADHHRTLLEKLKITALERRLDPMLVPV